MHIASAIRDFSTNTNSTVGQAQNWLPYLQNTQLMDQHTNRNDNAKEEMHDLMPNVNTAEGARENWLHTGSNTSSEAAGTQEDGAPKTHDEKNERR
jgi:hypothetical protein